MDFWRDLGLVFKNCIRENEGKDNLILSKCYILRALTLLLFYHEQSLVAQENQSLI